MDPRRIRLSVILIAAGALLRCGGANPASPSGAGVTLEGMVLLHHERRQRDRD